MLPQSKKLGATDPEFTYTITDGTMVSGESITGALARTTGETAGNYAINIGTLTAGNNYTITFVSADFIIKPNTAVISISTDRPRVYPNPTVDAIKLDIPEGKVSVLDLNGKIILETTLGKNKTIDLGSYPSGVYILILKTKDAVYEYRVVKK